MFLARAPGVGLLCYLIYYSKAKRSPGEDGEDQDLAGRWEALTLPYGLLSIGHRPFPPIYPFPSLCISHPYLGSVSVSVRENGLGGGRGRYGLEGLFRRHVDRCSRNGYHVGRDRNDCLRDA